MRRIPHPELYKARIRTGRYHSDDSYENNGAFLFHHVTTSEDVELFVIASDGTMPEAEDWEHVSVSTNNRCPTWEEMCYIKNVFWAPNETVIQFHPPEDVAVNTHNFCLHLWKKRGSEFELPPTVLVG